MTSPRPSRFFPPAEMADADGLVYVGGELSVSWLLDAYRHGIFPWPVCDYQSHCVLAWWSPDPRAIIELDSLRVSKRLRRTCRSGKFLVSCDRDFSGVIHGCASAPDRRGGTWLTPQMIDAYIELHARGAAHSVEVWQDGTLTGGTYGVALGGMFAAESMFYYVRDASKVALVHLVAHLKARGYQLFDIQQLTPHSARMGATEITRREYLARLRATLKLPVTFGAQLEPPPADS